MMNERTLGALRNWLRDAIGAEVAIGAAKPLEGGSIQENWRISCHIDGQANDFVLRRDAPAKIGSSRPRHEEFALLETAHQAGVRVPRPVAVCRDPAVIGVPFFLMQWVDGVGLGSRVVKDLTLGGDRVKLGERLGRELAAIHRIDGEADRLEFLGPRNAVDAAAAMIEGLRATLDSLRVVRPAIEWGLRWAELNAPPASGTVLVHNDYRTGNYMVDQQGLAAILDWEFAEWGDPLADIGWFCAECWRFGRNDLDAGGVAPRAVFYAGYESVSARKVDDAAVRYWEVVAHLRWAVIALEQAARHISGREPSLELALTGRIVPELELAILRATSPATWNFGSPDRAG